MAASRYALIEIGTRWSSSLVLAEAELALHRWREDVTRLRAYGWGETRRAAFETLVDRLRGRHDALTALKNIKLGTVPAEPSARKAALVWIDRARSILEAAELDHDGVTAALAALPEKPEGSELVLTTARETLANLRALRHILDPEAATDELFAAGLAATYTLEAALARPGDSLESRLTDEQRAEQSDLDALDGEIYLIIRGLNRAGQRLWHADGNDARAGRFVFQFLVTIGHGTDEASVPTHAPSLIITKL